MMVGRAARLGRPYVVALLLVVAATLPGLAVRTRIEPANLVMLYLLAVVLAGVYLGRGPAVLAAVAGVLAFDYLMVPPFLTLAVDDLEYLITFTALLVVGLVTSELAARSKERADAALERMELAERLQAAEMEHARDEAQTAILQAMSHDLRTPLVSITGALSTLADDSVRLAPRDERELVENALHESERLNHLVGDLLELSRLEAGTVPLGRSDCDVADLVGAALTQLGPRLAPHPIRTAVPNDLPPVRADFAAVTQVLVNLVDNAAKYSPPEAPIEVRAGPDAADEDGRDTASGDLAARAAVPKVRIEVADRGPGLAEEDLERPFARGARLAPQAGTSSGTGLGLTICKGIVEAHGGAIGLAQRPGGGLRAWFTLPVASPPREGDGPRAPDAVADPTA